MRDTTIYCFTIETAASRFLNSIIAEINFCQMPNRTDLIEALNEKIKFIDHMEATQDKYLLEAEDYPQQRADLVLALQIIDAWKGGFDADKTTKISFAGVNIGQIKVESFSARTR